MGPIEYITVADSYSSSDSSWRWNDVVRKRLFESMERLMIWNGERMRWNGTIFEAMECSAT